MAGRHSFDALVSELGPERMQTIEDRKAELRRELSLSELRNARRLTQASIGATLNVGQPSIAKLERRADMYVSNLRRYVEAMGGELDIIARFPDQEIRISNFSDIGEAPHKDA